MFGLDARRQQLRDEVEDWLARRQDPRDPVTLPVRLLLHMFLIGTGWSTAFVAGFAGAALAITTSLLVGISAAHNIDEKVSVPLGERDAMQEWITSGEASRLMRCDGEGLVFVNGRCHASGGGAWLIPLAAAKALEQRDRSIGQDDAVERDAKGNRRSPNPFEGAR